MKKFMCHPDDIAALAVTLPDLSGPGDVELEPNHFIPRGYGVEVLRELMFMPRVRIEIPPDDPISLFRYQTLAFRRTTKTLTERQLWNNRRFWRVRTRVKLQRRLDRQSRPRWRKRKAELDKRKGPNLSAGPFSTNLSCY